MRNRGQNRAGVGSYKKPGANYYRNSSKSTRSKVQRKMIYYQCLTRGKRKGGDYGMQVLGMLKNIQRVDKFGAINSPSTLTTKR